MLKGRAWVVPALMAAAWAPIVVGARPDGGEDGGAPYTPTRAEWLCMLLNVDRAVTDGSQFASSGLGVRFRYDHARPDAVQIELLYHARAPKAAIRYRARQAEEQAHEMAQLKGWDGWLKTEITVTEISGPPRVDRLEK